MNLTGKNVYLSGPMSGLDHNNVQGFARAHAIVRAAGAERIYNPADAWLSHSLEWDRLLSHEQYMLDSVNTLTHVTHDASAPFHPLYDVVVLLPGWSESAGARLEYEVARACGIKTLDLADVEDALRDGGR